MNLHDVLVDYRHNSLEHMISDLNHVISICDDIGIASGVIVNNNHR